TDLEPLEKSRSFLTARFRSRTDAAGVRLPIELIHKTRFFFASRCMMCFLLSGSLSQSLLKQIMSWPSIMVLAVGRYEWSKGCAIGCGRRTAGLDRAAGWLVESRFYRKHVRLQAMCYRQGAVPSS